MKKQEKNSHTFALYLPDLEYYQEELSVGSALTIEDTEVSLRAGKVLRLSRGDVCIFFNQQKHIVTEVIICNKSIFQVTITHVAQNNEYDPYITVLLPLLKRDALETAVYNLTEIGVNRIQLTMVQKVQRKWGGNKEYDRLQKIIIAAAEQAKNFAFPDLCQPLNFKEAIDNNPGEKIYFDVDCQPIIQMITKYNQSRPERITLIAGPEGGFSPQEITQLQKAKFNGFSLTPTVLRASQAITLGSGVVRSILSDLKNS